MYKKNTAGQFIHIQGVDATSGNIKSGVSWTVRRCIDGTFAAATGTATEDGATGWYKFAMSQADTNGNNIGFSFVGTGAVPQTVNIVTDGAAPDVNVTTIGGTSQTARDLGASVLLSPGTGTGQVDITSGVVKSNVTQIDGQATNGNNATLNLKKLSIVQASGGGDAVVVTGGAASGATPAGSAINATGGAASTTAGGVAGDGLKATGGAGAATTNPSGVGLNLNAGTDNGAGGANGAESNATGTGVSLSLPDGFDTGDSILGTINDGTPSTTGFTLSNEFPATADALVGMLLVVRTAGTNKGIPRHITAYTAGRVVTIDALPATPSNGDLVEAIALIV